MISSRSESPTQRRAGAGERQTVPMYYQWREGRISTVDDANDQCNSISRLGPASKQRHERGLTLTQTSGLQTRCKEKGSAAEKGKEKK